MVSEGGAKEGPGTPVRVVLATVAREARAFLAGRTVAGAGNAMRRLDLLAVPALFVVVVVAFAPRRVSAGHCAAGGAAAERGSACVRLSLNVRPVVRRYTISNAMLPASVTPSAIADVGAVVIML